uniref:Pyrin domain-containing protein n=1 Tax=Hucho hucho TaxID=62062 RepID=A0A4W5Q905_9TELE
SSIMSDFCKQLELFQWNLIHGVEGFTSIPRGQLENATRLVTVDRMVQQYHKDGAVKITLEILRKMGQNKLADELEKKFPNNV